MSLCIPGYEPNEKFLFHIPNVLSKEECDEWISTAERKGFEPASFLMDQQTKNPNRNNDRLLLFDSARAKLLTERLAPYLPVVWNKKWSFVGVNQRLGFLRYQTDEHYGRHVDVPYEDETLGVQSFLTCQLYLNQDFQGGCTRFMQEKGFKYIQDRSFMDIVPETGSVLLFEHELVHEGMAVVSGIKYSVRADVLYRKIRQTEKTF